MLYPICVCLRFTSTFREIVKRINISFYDHKLHMHIHCSHILLHVLFIIIIIIMLIWTLTITILELAYITMMRVDVFCFIFAFVIACGLILAGISISICIFLLLLISNRMCSLCASSCFSWATFLDVYDIFGGIAITEWKLNDFYNLLFVIHLYLQFWCNGLLPSSSLALAGGLLQVSRMVMVMPLVQMMMMMMMMKK